MLQIMKKNILPLLMAVVALCSCSDEDLGGFNGVKTGEVIDFGVSAVKTRANYTDGIDSKQVRWESGDVVRIYYVYTNTNGTVEKTYADYTVTPVDGEIGEHKELGSLVANDANNQLKWADGSGHKFYAVYPADKEITIDEKGVATFPINRDQKCTIRDKKSTESAYTYVAEPDDKNIYMVASATASPQSGSVWLDFKPIMTTINVVVKGPLNTTENQVTPNVVVTGVSLISTITTNTNASKSEFKYDITNGKITGSASGTGTQTEQTETTFISVVNTDGLNAIEMAKDETLVLTGFLPPMATETADVLERQVQIRVHTTGGNKTMTLENATALLPSAKGAIKLPSMYTPITGSNWITPLDDDIYVSQLSIPGAHDAATKNCALSSGKCQDLSITQQLEMGIRFFDLRPIGTGYWLFGLVDDGDDMPIYHGLTNCNITLQDVWREFNEFLNNNPDEFIITILRWEEEVLQTSGEEAFNDDMNDFVKSDLYKEHAAPTDIIKNDVTIGELRGKILSIMRPNQGTTPDGYFTETAPVGMIYISGFPGSHANGTQQAYCKPKYVNYGNDQWGSRTDWIVYCQNYYEVPNNDVNNKIEAIKTYLKHAQTQAEADDNVWVINHCSGYLGTTAIGDVYKELANKVNPEIYKYILQQSTDAEDKYKPVGSTGILLLDFVGSRISASANVTVYGDLLPQTIIDNNYKYRMKRKGENSK